MMLVFSVGNNTIFTLTITLMLGHISIVLCPSGDGGITCQDEYNKILRENCDCNFFLGGWAMKTKHSRIDLAFVYLVISVAPL